MATPKPAPSNAPELRAPPSESEPWGSPGQIRDWLVNFANTVAPPFRSPARPQAKLPGTDRYLDLMGAISALSDLAPGKAGTAAGLKGAALLPPGWTLNPNVARDATKRAYRASITVPGKRVPVPVVANFRQRPLHQAHPERSPGIWNLNWLGKEGAMGDPEEFFVGPGGSLLSAQSGNLGDSGIRQLLTRFRDETPEARWLTFHRSGGAAAKAKGNAAEAFLLQPNQGERLGFINAVRDTAKPPTDMRWQRYRTYLREVHGLDLNPRAPVRPMLYDPLDEP